MKKQKNDFFRNLVVCAQKVKLYRNLALAAEMFKFLVDSAWGFLLPIATYCFSKGNIKIALFFIALAMCGRVIISFLTALAENAELKYDKYGEVDAIKKSNRILDIVKGKIVFTNSSNETKIKTNVEVLETIFRYITCYRKAKYDMILTVFNAIVFVFTFIGMIQTIRISVNQNLVLFVIVMLICIFVIFLVSMRQIKRRKKFYSELVKLQNTMDSEKMDLLSVKTINKEHKNWITGNYISAIKNSKDKEIDIRSKERKEAILNTCVISFCTVALLVLSLGSINDIDAIKFMQLITLSTLYSNVFYLVSSQAFSIQKLIEEYYKAKGYGEFMAVVEEKHRKMLAKKINLDINIENISIDGLSFIHEDLESNKCHKITSDGKIVFGNGLNLISGKSGSGKSTLIKILTGENQIDINNITLNDKDKVKDIVNACICYEPDYYLGNKSVLEELTFTTLSNFNSDSNVELLYYILEGLDLLDSLQSKAKDISVVEFFSTTYPDFFSVGQKQRLILARTLYNVGDKQVVILDEPTANLDDVTEKKVMLFLEKFCREKGRILIVVSHQLEILQNLANTHIRFVPITEEHYEIVKANN